MPVCLHGFRVDNVRGDIFGGLTAAVVALPLALAFGVASGAGPIAGVYGAIFVGFFAALFGGTPAQVSGPTGPMTVVMAAVVTQFAHQPAMAFTVVMLAGLLQITFGLLRFGRFINLMPFPVISGFMSGIGCIIIILQLAPLAGRANPTGQPYAAMVAWPDTLLHPIWPALGLGLASFAIATCWPTRLAKWIPGPLAALIIGVGLSLTVLPGAPLLGEVPAGFPALTLPSFTLHDLPEMVEASLMLALLGSIDSLLTSLVADNITQTRHRSNRELIGQGIGNAVAGLMGAMPGAGATMRTVVNVRAGGRTPLSGALHAVVLLAVMLGLGPYAAKIPHAVLAGILIRVGLDIVDWRYLTMVRRAPRAGVAIMLTVLLLTVFLDLIVAVAVGVVMASLLFVKRMSDLQLSSLRRHDRADSPGLSAAEQALFVPVEHGVVLVELHGAMTFGAASAIAQELDSAGTKGVLIIDLAHVPLIDTSACMALDGIVERIHAAGRELVLTGLQPQVATTLGQLGVLGKLPHANLAHSRLHALERATALLHGEPDALAAKA